MQLGLEPKSQIGKSTAKAMQSMADKVRQTQAPGYQPSGAYSSGQSDLKICLFFHEFWAFWLYARLSCSSSCSDLQVRSSLSPGALGDVHTCCPSACSQARGPTRPRHLYMQVFFKEHHRFSSLSSAARICVEGRGGPGARLLGSPEP